MISIIVILSKIILSPFVLCSQDLLVGFDFAPLVSFNEDINSLEVDMSLVHDVKEQAYMALARMLERHSEIKAPLY